MSILIKEDEFRDIINNLDEDIKRLESIYDDINNKAKKLDGNDDMWKSETQEVVYDYYQSISKDFPDNINRLKSLSNYLNNTLNNYVNEENDTNSDIDESGSNLSINDN